MDDVASEKIDLLTERVRDLERQNKVLRDEVNRWRQINEKRAQAFRKQAKELVRLAQSWCEMFE